MQPPEDRDTPADDHEEDAFDDLLAGAFGAQPEGPPSVVERLAQQGRAVPSIHVPDPQDEAAPPLKHGGERAMPRAGDRIGRYVIIGEIARGGMGVVYQARDLDLGREVALKLLREERRDHAEILERFVEEAQISGQLQHPGIVPIYEMGLDASHRPWFAMELIRGRTLQRMLSEAGDAADERPGWLEIFEQVCRTLAYAHARQVIHRDLKPANVMVGAFGEVQVVDWGFAKVLARGGMADEIAAAARSTETAPETFRSGPDSSLSIAGSVVGTPSYMAPEQARGAHAEIDERADVFSLGAILCEILTGEPPYRRQPGSSILEQASEASLDDALERLEGVHDEPDLAALARRCMATEPGNRPATAEEVVEAIAAWRVQRAARERASREEAVAARERVRSERKARRLTLALGSVLVLVVAGAGIALHLGQLAEVERTREQDARIEGLFDSARLALADRDLEGARSDLERAAALIEAGPVSPHLPTVRAGLARTLEDALTARREAVEAGSVAMAAEQRDRRLRDQLEEALDGSLTGETAGTIAAAFAEYGIDFDGKPSTIAESIRARGDAALREDVVRALDTWAGLVNYRRGRSSEPIRHLLLIANDLDEDPWRQELRDATFAKDRERLVELAEEVDPTRTGRESIRFLVDALRTADEDTLALSVLRNAVKVHVDDAVLHQRLGATLVDDEEALEEAHRHVAMALALEPEDADNHRLLYRVLLKREGPEAALARLQVSRISLPESRRLSLEVARHQRQHGDLELALSELEILLASDTRDRWALRELALVHEARGDSEALSATNRRLRELRGPWRRGRPSGRTARTERPSIDLEWARADTASVLRELRRKVEDETSDATARLRLASLALATGRYELALDQAGAVDDGADRADAAMIEARALTELGLYADAQAAWDRAVEAGARSVRIDIALEDLERLRRRQASIDAGDIAMPPQTNWRDAFAHFRALARSGRPATALRDMQTLMTARQDRRSPERQGGRGSAGGRGEVRPPDGRRERSRRDGPGPEGRRRGGRPSMPGLPYSMLDRFLTLAEAGLPAAPQKDPASDEERERWRREAQRALQRQVHITKALRMRSSRRDLIEALHDLHWTSDPRLAPIRERSLALPGAEREQWRTIWARVDALAPGQAIPER